MGTAIKKHLMPDRVKPSFVILTSGHFDPEKYV